MVEARGDPEGLPRLGHHEAAPCLTGATLLLQSSGDNKVGGRENGCVWPRPWFRLQPLGRKAPSSRSSAPAMPSLEKPMRGAGAKVLLQGLRHLGLRHRLVGVNDALNNAEELAPLDDQCEDLATHVCLEHTFFSSSEPDCTAGWACMLCKDLAGMFHGISRSQQAASKSLMAFKSFTIALKELHSLVHMENHCALLAAEERTVRRRFLASEVAVFWSFGSLGRARSRPFKLRLQQRDPGARLVGCQSRVELGG